MLELLEVAAYSAGSGGLAGTVTVIRANEPNPEQVECPVAGDFTPTVGGRVWVETGVGSWVAIAPELAAPVDPSAALGIRWICYQTNNWTLNVTGTEETICATDPPLAVKHGRSYKVTWAGGHSIVTGGSGFSVGDYWEFWLEREVNNSGSWAEFPAAPSSFPARMRLRTNQAIAARFPPVVLIGYYMPAIPADVAFRVRGVKGSGASTVTCTLDTNGGASPETLTVEDTGLWSG